MNNFIFLVALSEKEKRILIALIIIVALLIVLVGLIYNGLVKLTKKMGRGIDSYVHELCKHKVLTSPKELIECVAYRERKRLYISNRWSIRLAITAVLGTIFLFYQFLDGDFSKMSDAFTNLNLRFIWPRGNFFGIKNFIIGWPNEVIYPQPKWDLASIITYCDIIIFTVFLFLIIRSIMNYTGRIQRAKSVATSVFGENLDTANFATE